MGVDVRTFSVAKDGAETLHSFVMDMSSSFCRLRGRPGPLFLAVCAVVVGRTQFVIDIAANLMVPLE